MTTFGKWTQADVARHNAKGNPVVKGSLPTDKDCLSVEAEPCALGEEIKGLHAPFIQWCNLNQVLYSNSNPTRKSTVQSGQFDFLCMKNGCGCAVEMKALADPASGLSQDQKDWRDKANRCEVPWLVTNNLAEAIRFVTRELEL